MQFSMTLVQMSCVEGEREKNFKTARRLLEELKPTTGVSCFLSSLQLAFVMRTIEKRDQECLDRQATS